MFKKKKSKSLSVRNEPTVYPDGVCVETPQGVYLIKGQKRYRVPTQRILDSWAFPLIVETTEEALRNYKVAARLGFRDGSLIYNIADGKMYLVSNNKRRHITSPDALELLGVDRSRVVNVSNFEINLQQLGEDII